MKIREIILWIVIVIAIVTVLWYAFGNSPSFEQAILVLLLGLAVTTLVKLKVLETRFSFLARDFREHLNKKN